jgi:hypothetical protein
MLVRVFVAVLILSLAVVVMPAAAAPRVPLILATAGFLYCTAAYFALLSADLRGDEYGRFMAMAILAYQC